MRLSVLFQVPFRCFFFLVLERGDFAHVAVGVRLLGAAAGARAGGEGAAADGETKGASWWSKRRQDFTLAASCRKTRYS